MRCLVRYFDCGNLYSIKIKEAVDYSVEKYSDLIEKIILFFSRNILSLVLSFKILNTSLE